MSGNDGTSKASWGWSDKERIVYLLGLLDTVKPDYKNAPRPAGRSEIACERMVGRLKTTYKTELEALKAGQPSDGEVTPKKKPRRKAKVTPKSTPTRKGNVDELSDIEDFGIPKDKTKGKGGYIGDDEDDGSPKKKGRKAAVKIEVKEESPEEMEDEIMGEAEFDI